MELTGDDHPDNYNPKVGAPRERFSRSVNSSISVQQLPTGNRRRKVARAPTNFLSNFHRVVKTTSPEHT